MYFYYKDILRGTYSVVKFKSYFSERQHSLHFPLYLIVNSWVVKRLNKRPCILLNNFLAFCLTDWGESGNLSQVSVSTGAESKCRSAEYVALAVKCFIVIFPTDNLSGVSVSLRNIWATCRNIRVVSKRWQISDRRLPM
jgi:hypothetical protein